MSKKVLSVVLAVVLVVGCSMGVSAAEATTWEQKINALELRPVNRSAVEAGDSHLVELYGDNLSVNIEYHLEIYDRYASLAKPGMTNYEILRAVYDYIVANYGAQQRQKTNNSSYWQCTSYAHELCEALYIVGFDVRYMTGECTVKGGGWTAHAWSAIRVGDEILYFDANIPGEYGGNADTYFAMVPTNTTFYRNAVVKIIEYSPGLGTTAVYEGERPDWLEW